MWNIWSQFFMEFLQIFWISLFLLLIILLPFFLIFVMIITLFSADKIHSHGKEFYKNFFQIFGYYAFLIFSGHIVFSAFVSAFIMTFFYISFGIPNNEMLIVWKFFFIFGILIYILLMIPVYQIAKKILKNFWKKYDFYPDISLCKAKILIFFYWIFIIFSAWTTFKFFYF